ncbi:beta-1,3-glucan-binding protein [Colletotrichum higginsianum]|uniref:Beta-1,3-glucan-binding protein n=2 Tax=Colletotrichum destructivum species complex TaxID=2707350 RepID=H1V1N3_COLHI|nr:Beta-1,3-glucan-binding protein [Colletotrichum higginsianum IMI 349063]OBR08219.1 Beta-1,3-glucan-binding protein [Colletotrichum higginsianum IMI 349063]GJC97702.1 beta1,3-glucan-binding protein [Colletotrichum higginsianum]CCF34135.1 beta-1,3-glucan-binding protein [Colletotrichum higginsianum]
MDQDQYGQGYYSRPVAGMPSTATTASATPNRPGTPNTENSRNPFGDGIESQASQRGPVGTNPFGTPAVSRPASSFGSSSAIGARFDERSQRYFHSRRIRKEDVEKPWLDKSDPKEKWVTIIPIVGIFIGLAVSGFLVWDGIRSVVKHKYCPVLMEDFASGSLDSNVWTKEVEVGGFGNGEFQMTTADDENVFIKDGNLFIRPTLTDSALIEKDTVIDLLKDGTCTSDQPSSCIAATNTTAGNSSIVPPTRSGRINTKKGATIKYGRVEVVAKLPKGDWLWPAIWMMPVDSTYGPWPLSGEIDILESRGNNWTYSQGGNNIASSALHWGPDQANDAWWRTNNKRQALHTTYADGFNTFGLEWSQKYIFTYINSRLLQVLYTNFEEPMWQRGDFPQTNSNGSRLEDVWSQTGRANTPFDQRFYLIINVAVGGTNGWFEDGKSGKPWVGTSPNAKKDFWQARDQWLPTWTSPELTVSKVSMWQQCDGNEEL